MKAQSTNENLCDVAEITLTIRDYFQCRNWYPLYETTVYDAMCYEGTEGFTWVATTQFIVVFMAMVMLTLRGAFYDLDIMDSGDDSDGTGDSVDRATLQQQKKQRSPPRVVVSPFQDGGFELSPQGDAEF